MRDGATPTVLDRTENMMSWILSFLLITTPVFVQSSSLFVKSENKDFFHKESEIMDIKDESGIQTESIAKRSVYDIIPGLGSHRKVGSRCRCSDGSRNCIFDERFQCRRTLSVLSQSENLQNIQRKQIEGRRKHRRHLKKLLKKLLKEEMEFLL